MDKIFNTVRGFSMSRVLFTFTKMGIVDIIADAGSPLTAEEIAPRVAPDQQAEPLFRLLRCVAGLEFLDMHEGPVDNVNYHQTYRFSLNETSHLLRQGAPWRHLVLHLGNDAVYRVWGGLETAVKTGQSSVPATLGKPTFWDYLLEHDDINQYFNQAMSANTTQQTDQILGSYDFSHVSSVADVGGGLGNLLFGILNKYPDISKGHLFEIQSVIDKVVVPDGLRERVELHAGSFLDENTGIPVGLDLYIVKAIIHDWADPEARQILTALRMAMRPHSKLLVMEHIVPRGGSTFASSIDLHMMVMLGAKERTEEEYKLLLASAGLVLTEVHSRQQRLNLIEARLAGPEEDNK